MTVGYMPPTANFEAPIS
uniref:Uncharacterized protein n=1 Tax=Anguilla anguilla TaxID=7936 RepID=A0A0E9U6C3_ANGAN